MQTILATLEQCGLAMQKRATDQAMTTKKPAREDSHCGHAQMQRECKTVLTFVTMCLHRNLPWQNFIRERHSEVFLEAAPPSLGLQLPPMRWITRATPSPSPPPPSHKVEHLLRAINASLRVHQQAEGGPLPVQLVGLLHCTLTFLCAATEGPCQGNQAFFLRAPQDLTRTLYLLLQQCGRIFHKDGLDGSCLHTKAQCASIKIAVYNVFKALMDSSLETATITSIANTMSPKQLSADIAAMAYPVSFDDERRRHIIHNVTQAFMTGTVRSAFHKMRKHYEESWSEERQQAEQQAKQDQYRIDAHKITVEVETIGLEAFCLLQQFSFTQPGYRHALEKLYEKRDLYAGCMARTTCVEVLRFDRVHRFFFIVPDACLELLRIPRFSKHVDNALGAVTRETVQKKALSLGSSAGAPDLTHLSMPG
jgi:hypothetical protein